MRGLAGGIGALALAMSGVPAARAQKASDASPPGPVASMLLGICLPWIAGIEPKKMVETLAARGLKADWVGTRLAGFELPRRPDFIYSGIILGEGAAWCEIMLTYPKTRIGTIAAEIDAAAPRIPNYFRLAPVKPVKDQYGNLPDRAWAAPGATMTFTEKATLFPGATSRDASIHLEKK